MESLNVKNINDEKIFNVIDPNGQGEVVNRIRPISISINQKAETMNDQTNSTINLAVYWNDTWKSILDLTFDESLRQEYGKLTEDLTKIQKDIDMKQYKDAETKTNDFLKYVANLSSKYTAIPEKAVVAKTKNDFIKITADKNSIKATISDKLLNFMLKKYAKVDNLDYTKANECFSTSKFNFLANNYDFYYHSPEIFQKQAYMTVVKDNKVVGSYKVNYDQFSKFASKFMLTPQKLGYSKDRLAGYMKTAEVVMQNIFFDSVDEAKEWQEMVDEKKKEQATTPEGEEETTETTTTETKTEMGKGKSESPAKEDGGLARPSEDFASDEIPESEPRQQDQQGGGQNLGASRRVNLLKKKAGVRQTQKINNTINDIKQYYNELNQKSKEELIKKVLESNKDFSKEFGNKGKNVLENKDEEYLKQILLRNKYKYDEGYDFAFENFGPDEQNINDKMLDLLNKGMITKEFYKGIQQGLRDASINDVLLRKEKNLNKKKAKVGWNAKPENELEEIAVKIGDEIMEEGGFVFGQIQDINEEIRLNPAIKEQKGKELAELEEKHKKVVEDIVRKYRKEFANETIAKLVDEHLEDNNFHTESSIVSEFVDNEILASKKVKLNKKAGIDMNLSYGHFLKEEDENKLPKFNTLEDIKTYIKTNNKFPGNFFYKGGLFTEDEYDMDGMVVTYGSPEIDKAIVINTPDNRYNYKGNYKNLDMDIVEEDAPYFRTDVNYTLPKKVYEELFPKKNSNKNLNLNKKAEDITEIEENYKESDFNIKYKNLVIKDNAFVQEELKTETTRVKVEFVVYGYNIPNGMAEANFNCVVKPSKANATIPHIENYTISYDVVLDDETKKQLDSILYNLSNKKIQSFCKYNDKGYLVYKYQVAANKKVELNKQARTVDSKQDIKQILKDKNAVETRNYGDFVSAIRENKTPLETIKAYGKKKTAGGYDEYVLVVYESGAYFYTELSNGKRADEKYYKFENVEKKAENRKNYNVVIGFDGKEEESDFAQEDVISALQEALIYFGEKWHELPSSLDNIDKLDFVKIREIEKGETVKEYTKEDILKMKEDFPKYSCNKKALYGDVQEQDIVPAKTETKVYLQSSDKDLDKIWGIKMFVDKMDSKDGMDVVEFTKIGLIDHINGLIEEHDSEHDYGNEKLDYNCSDELLKEMVTNYLDGTVEFIKEAKVKKQAEETIEEKIEDQVGEDGDVKGVIGVGDVVTVCVDKLEYPEEAFKYTELIGEPLLLMDNDKENIEKVIVEQTEYPYQRMTVNKDDIVLYDEVKGEQVIVEDEEGDTIITELAEVPIVAKQCKIKSIHKAANITKKKANLTKKAINSLEDVAGLIDTIVSDYDWYGYFDSTEVGELSLYDQFLADVQKDEKGTIEKVLKYIAEDDDGYTAPEVEQLKEYYNAKFGGK